MLIRIQRAQFLRSIVRGIAALAASAPTRFGALVVEQDSPWRGIDIVELARANRPHEGADGNGREYQRQWKNEVEYCHQRNAFDRKELASTVSELSGMTAAAISGWMRPLIASAPATML